MSKSFSISMQRKQGYTFYVYEFQTQTYKIQTNVAVAFFFIPLCPLK